MSRMLSTPAAFGGAEQRAQVLGVFDAVEGEDETRLRAFQNVFEIEELAFADDGHDALVGCGLGHTGEGVAGLEAGFDAGFAAEIEELGEAVVLLALTWAGTGAGTMALTRDAHVVEAAGPGAEGFFDGVQAVQVFHSL